MLANGYPVVISSTSTGFCAYVPDLPGCVATGQTLSQVRGRIQRAVETHLAGMREDGEAVPEIEPEPEWRPADPEAEKDFHGHGVLGDD
jgi:predicted RNase H-like HicB family nuclease